ncbi:sensor histidine kinase [Devosia insulae]|uniref:sensor histidine kinase n=1 Tax=Devosia insulae TaxID=408174 RepID=UPI000A0723CF|nr:ATP-binding protein [Devosia insulae]
MSSQAVAERAAAPGGKRSQPLIRTNGYRVSAAVLALAIFLFDTLSPLEGAVAVLYILVVFMVARTGRRTEIIATAAACLGLTLLAYLISHGIGLPGSPTLRALVSIAAIGVAALLALQNQSATATLVRSERRYRRMFDATRIGVMQEDWSRVRSELADTSPADLEARAPELIRIVDVNPAFLAMVGAADAGSFRGTVGDILGAGDRTFAGALAAFARGDAHFEGETELIGTDGRRVPVLFAITFPATPEDDGNALVFVLDITERREAHDALHLAQAELAHAARVATLGELTASIAHEVNQPLMAVVTNGEAGMRWLRREPPDLGEVETAMARVISEGRRASDIVKRIRAFLSKAPSQPAELSVPSLIEEASALVERELARAGVHLSVKAPEGLPPVLGDRVQLQQVLVNLMVNASQAMADHPGNRRLAVKAWADGGKVEIMVADTGPGIAPDDLQRLFDPFFTTKPDGMGMGLAICRTTVEAHGGSLTVESVPPHGATFRLSLPTRELAT